jgi:hypothetical protein
LALRTGLDRALTVQPAGVASVGGECERRREPDLPRIVVFDDAADPDVFMNEAVEPG